MCLILIAYKTDPRCPFIVAANRDEFYERPTRAADFWPGHFDILGGRDLRDGGTWLGITRKGRFAALTNFRDPASVKPDAPSRGNLVSRFLTGDDDADRYLAYLKEIGPQYNGFSMLFGHPETLYYYCNRSGGGGILTPGVHALSNALLDTSWPKVQRGKEELARIVRENRWRDTEALFELLADRSRPPDESLPQTGVGLEWERILSPLFIESPAYGTRCSTVMTITGNRRVTFEERTFEGNPSCWTAAYFEYTLGDAS